MYIVIIICSGFECAICVSVNDLQYLKLRASNQNSTQGRPQIVPNIGSSCFSLFQVVFSATQLSWLSSEQACAVTEEQWAELDSEQRQALGMAQYEGELMLEHRGKQCRSSSNNDVIWTLN